jgi:hypothetical protein
MKEVQYDERPINKNDKSSPAIVIIVALIGLAILVGFISYITSSGQPNNQTNTNTTSTQQASTNSDINNTTGQNVISSSSNNTSKSLPDIVAEWQKSTAYVECYWNYPNMTPFKWYLKESGSGLLANFNSVPTIITNRHIAYNSQYGMATQCDVAFPNDNYQFYDITLVDEPSYTSYLIPSEPVVIPETPAHGKIQFTSDGSDIAYLSGMKESVTNPTLSLNARARNDHFACDSNPPTGESIVVLGYPDYGTNAGQFQSVLSTIDPTVTEGIIAGQDGIYLTTSAKIDPGNSGGLAIDETNDCYIGIPTAIEVGEAGTLGRILPASYAVH